MKLKTISLIAAAFYLAFFLAVATYTKSGIQVRVMDVGQGDSIFIRTPDNFTMLIDGGGDYQADQELAKEMFFPFCHLDYLVVTHPHMDHIGGLEKILKRCSVGIVMFNDVSYESSTLDDFRHLIRKNKVINGLAGNEFDLGKTKIKILWPDPDITQARVKNLNDTSIVLFLDYGNFEALFMGDLEADYQNNLDLSSIKGLIDGRLEMIKIAHHGSSNGVYMPLIDELKPEKCVVSVGKDNSYGHPNRQSLLDLTGSGCQVLRTDLLGDIVITKD
jgi:competence protein ComEC